MITQADMGDERRKGEEWPEVTIDTVFLVEEEGRGRGEAHAQLQQPRE